MLSFDLKPEAILTLITAGEKLHVLETLADQFSKCYGLDRAMVFDRMLERERLGSTGFGRGVAIPHAKMPGLTQPVAIFMRLSKEIRFDAVDGLPVGIVMGLVSPESGGAQHLQALARISRILRDERVLATLKGTQERDAIYAVLTDVIERDAA